GLRVEEEQAAARKRFVRAGRGKYTAEEVQQLADGLGVSVEQLQHCWILQRHSQYYVLQPDGDYFAETRESLQTGVRRALAPAPCDLTKPTKHGVVDLSERELMAEYGTAIRKVAKSMTLQSPAVDLEDAALTLPACPLLP